MTVAFSLPDPSAGPAIESEGAVVSGGQNAAPQRCPTMLSLWPHTTAAPPPPPTAATGLNASFGEASTCWPTPPKPDVGDHHAVNTWSAPALRCRQATSTSPAPLPAATKSSAL